MLLCLLWPGGPQRTSGEGAWAAPNGGPSFGCAARPADSPVKQACRMKPGFAFALEATDGAARAGMLTTPHGSVATPLFMPVATAAAMKGLTPAQVRRPPPLLGEHTDAVLEELGVGAAERARLRAQGVIGPA